MQVTPGAVCQWYCREDFLAKALSDISKHGSELLAVVPVELRPNREGFGLGLKVTMWIVLYKNPVGDL